MNKQSTTWAELVNEGKKHQSDPHVNILKKEDMNAIFGTMEFFDASIGWMQLSHFDLMTAKYRVFDWLAMCVGGRNDRTESNNTALKVLVYAFRTAKYDERKFIKNLQVVDYQVDTGWETIELS